MKAMILLALAALSALPVLAQQSPPMGRGQGCCIGKRNIAGWSLMSPEERTEHRNRMRDMKSFDECVRYQKEHHEAMAKRAKGKGVTLPEARGRACERMKARGQFR